MLLFPLWYPTFEAAVGYARFLGRQSGCEVRVNNSDGGQVNLIRVKKNSPGEKRSLAGRNALELQACNMELREQIASMTRLEWELLESNEREHRRFGWDLHEDLGQQLAGITFLASLLAKQLELNRPDLFEELGELVSQLREAILNTRNIARGLYPIGLENGGLSMVLEEFANWISQVEGIPCEFRKSNQAASPNRERAGNASPEKEEPEFEVPKASAIHFYRIAQEAVNYLLKIGRVRRISIECVLSKSSPKLIVTGEGGQFAEYSAEGAGLMHSRAQMIGAEISFEKTQEGQYAIICALKSNQAQSGRQT